MLRVSAPKLTSAPRAMRVAATGLAPARPSMTSGIQRASSARSSLYSRPSNSGEVISCAKRARRNATFASPSTNDRCGTGRMKDGWSGRSPAATSDRHSARLVANWPAIAYALPQATLPSGAGGVELSSQ